MNHTLVTQLLQTAQLEDLPNERFFSTFTARRRRAMVYHLTASAADFAVRLRVTGSGSMTAELNMPCVMVDDGSIEHIRDMHVMSWARTGEQAVLKTALDHLHLVNKPDATTVLSAFLDAIGTQKQATCPGGYAMWMRTMQLMTARIAREKACRVEVVASPPTPADNPDAHVRKSGTIIEITNVDDAEEPQPIRGYGNDFKTIDETMTPEAMTLTLVAPGFLLERRHREIFHAG